MRDQLTAGLALGAVAVTAAAADVMWLAVAAFAAALPFLVIGILLALGTRSERGGRAAGSH